MKLTGNNDKKMLLTSKIMNIVIIFSCVISMLVLPNCRKRKGYVGPQWPELPPPDLSNCTSVELRYGPSTLGYFAAGVKWQDIVNDEETEYLQSLETITADDREFIKALALDVSQGSYDGPVEEGTAVPTKRIVYIVCYCNGERLTSLSVFGNRIQTEDKKWFRYDKGLPSLETFIPPQILMFYLRTKCVDNLRSLYQTFWFYFQKNKSYPSPDKWCEAVIQHNQDGVYGDDMYMEFFKCPSADEGKCNYAVNPNCKPDSPPDTVLLFEAKAGWNQHGGPELFTFDNHEPKGGCVLLNDGNLYGVASPTIRFIRTKEELNSLRWK